MKKVAKRPTSLPKSFRPLLWSYNFSRLDPWRDRQTIVQQTLNYGDWGQWRWLKRHYGLAELRRVVATVPAMAFRTPVRRLISLVLNAEPYTHAPRGAHRRR